MPTVDEVRRSWAATVAALPVGSRIACEVIGRQSFGVLLRIDGVPDALGLAEITAMPQGMDLPPSGTSSVARCSGTPAATTKSRSGSSSGWQPTSDLRWAVSGPPEAAQWRPLTTTTDSCSGRHPQVTQMDLRHW